MTCHIIGVLIRGVDIPKDINAPDHQEIINDLHMLAENGFIKSDSIKKLALSGRSGRRQLHFLALTLQNLGIWTRVSRLIPTLETLTGTGMSSEGTPAMTQILRVLELNHTSTNNFMRSIRAIKSLPARLLYICEQLQPQQ